MNLRKRLMWPLFGLLLLLLVGIVIASGQTFRLFLQQQVQREIVAAESYFTTVVRQENDKLGGMALALRENPAVRVALAARDRAALLALTGPLFEEWRERFAVTHLYFTDPQRINLLRVHMPQRHGDRIERVTTLQAEQTGQPAWGLELGPLGTFTLRHVMPVRAEGELLGYLEVGEEVDHLLRGLAGTFGGQALVAIEKRYLDAEAWQAGMAMLGRANDWDRFPQLAIVSQDMAQLPPPVQQRLREYSSVARQPPLPLSFAGREFIAGSLPLVDAAQRQVGVLFLLTDVTELLKQLAASRGRNLVGIALVLGAIMLLFRWGLRRTEQALAATQAQLRLSLEEMDEARDHAEALTEIANCARREAEAHAEQVLASQEELEQAHRDWMAAFDGVDDLMFLHDRENRVMRANRAYLQRAGRTWEECAGQPYWQIYPLLPGPLCSCMAARTSATEQEEELNLEDGTVFLSRSVPVFDREGQYLHSLHIMQDVTARRSAEAAMRLRDRAMESSSNGIVITDYMAPDNPVIYVNPAFERITGYCREEVLGRNLRFIYGTDTEQPVLEDIRAALREGHACDVVVRNYRKNGDRFWNELSLAPVRGEYGEISHYVGILNDITARKEYEEQLVYQANYDMLTGLANRNLLADRGAQAVLQGQRTEQMVAVLLFNLDRFKVVVDTLGHQAGDDLLREVAARLSRCVTEGDTVARLGADEFALLLTGLDSADDILPIERRLLAELEQPLLLLGQETYLAASIGISLYPRDGNRFDTLLKNADAAMHRAKERGGGGVQFYAEEMTRRSSRQLALDTCLRHALQRNELLLHYQPKVDLVSGMMVGAEALVRWQHPEWGMVSPGEFIPVAEETGLIVALGEWVLEEACEQNRTWQEQGFAPLTIAVNLSARQFRQPNLVPLVQQALQLYGLAPRYLELELTESMVMHDPEGAIATMRQLKALGVRLALDDFGTGYSSLAYLKRFPIDCIKIDAAFIRDIINKPEDAAITLAVIAMAHNLGMKVVAEGVETEAQLNFLRRHHCDEIQGFFFSRPLPQAAFAELLQEERGLPAPTPATAQRTLLILDDEPNVVRALERVLRREGYQILTATSAAAAFVLLAKHRVHVIISDQRMPEMSGTEFLSQVKRLYPHTVRMILSGYTELQTVTEAVNRGAIYKFLTKPWEDEVLRDTVRQAFQRAEKAQAEYALCCNA